MKGFFFIILRNIYSAADTRRKRTKWRINQNRRDFFKNKNILANQQIGMDPYLGNKSEDDDGRRSQPFRKPYAHNPGNPAAAVKIPLKLCCMCAVKIS